MKYTSLYFLAKCWWELTSREFLSLYFVVFSICCIMLCKERHQIIFARFSWAKIVFKLSWSFFFFNCFFTYLIINNRHYFHYIQWNSFKLGQILFDVFLQGLEGEEGKLSVENETKWLITSYSTHLTLPQMCQGCLQKWGNSVQQMVVLRKVSKVESLLARTIIIWLLI